MPRPHGIEIDLSPLAVFLSSFLEGLAKRIRIYFHSCFQFNLNHLHPPKFAPTLEFIAPALMLRKCKLKTDKLKVISVRYTENLITYLKCHANCKWRFRKLNSLTFSKSGYRIAEIFWAVFSSGRSIFQCTKIRVIILQQGKW